MTRSRFSTQVDSDVQERARAAVRGVAKATGRDYTLAQLTEDALSEKVDVLEEQYNGGEPFPPAESLPRGRRLRG